jgi:hypothetical protein
MAAQLNHTIVWSSDQTMSARFLAEMLGRPAPTRFGHFDVVELDNGGLSRLRRRRRPDPPTALRLPDQRGGF